MKRTGIKTAVNDVFLLLMAISIPVLTGCEKIDRPGFTELPGFVEYFSTNPPSRKLPDPQEKELLRHFRPRFMLPPGHQGAVDFYRDYIEHGTLRSGTGKITSKVKHNTLNAHKEDYGAVFVHCPGNRTLHTAVVYGRITHDIVTFNAGNEQIGIPFIFLTYNIVFRTSGPPAGIPAWQDAVLGFFFNLNDWHQLDHFTSVTVVLKDDNSGMGEPVAVILQQHDTLRTYLANKDIPIPEDNRVVVDVAIRSNEIYPHVPGRGIYRAVRIPDADGLHFLISGKDKPVLAGHDITHGIHEVEYDLAFLPPDDAFYTFKGRLGEQRLLPGRDGPPGADYNTLPELKPMPMQMFFGYWRENNQGDIERLNRTIRANNDYRGFALLQKQEFFRDWQEVREKDGK